MAHHNSSRAFVSRLDDNVRLRDNLTRDERAALKGLQNRSIRCRLEYALFTLHYCFAFCDDKLHACMFVSDEDWSKRSTI